MPTQIPVILCKLQNIHIGECTVYERFVIAQNNSFLIHQTKQPHILPPACSILRSHPCSALYLTWCDKEANPSMSRILPVVNTIPPGLQKSDQSSGTTSRTLASDGAANQLDAIQTQDRADLGIPEEEFNRIFDKHGWRGFLFEHATAPQMLHEVTDALYGLSEALSSKAKQLTNELKPSNDPSPLPSSPPLSSPPLASSASDASCKFAAGNAQEGLSGERDTTANPPHFLLTFEDAMEGVRRILLFMDPKRASVARASRRQISAITASLLRDNALSHMMESSTATGDYSLHAGVDDVVFQPKTHDGSGHEFIPVKYGREPAELMRNMPLWFSTVNVIQSLFVRTLARGLGVQSVFTETDCGVWHTYMADGRLVDDSQSPPVVIIHGMFTTSISVLPLAIALAASLKRVVLAPGLLDFDFGFSTSKRDYWAKRISSPVSDKEADSCVSPLTWSDHVPAIADYLRVGVPQIMADAGDSLTGVSRSPVDVVGHSLGGWIASKIASRHPELINKLVLLAPGGLGRYRIVSSAAPLASLRTSINILQQKMGSTSARIAAGIFNIIGRAPFTVHLVTSLNYQDYFSPGEVVPHDALLLWGSEDDLHRTWSTVSSAHGEGTDDRMLRDLPRGKGVWLSGASHALVVDSIPSIVRLIAEFLDHATPAVSKSQPRQARIHHAGSAVMWLSAKLGGNRVVSPMVRSTAQSAKL